MTTAIPVRTLSVTDAASRGVSSLVASAESGQDVVVERRGKPVAVVVGMGRLARLDKLESELRDISLLLARAATDTGERVDLDDALAVLGFDRSELEAELARDIAAGRE
ncbi:MAG: type II toxin-antitoxin system prevent-host-death family antitoxin [Actinomycetota bacterium]|nr:type II toxin-antitoxin system prevent-host-death family antitoxin [Actinomycetota bacterium]